MATQPAISVEGLIKRFGDTTALDGIDFAVEPGTVLGLLGPNGAGKTTAVRILTTLLKPDAGRVTAAGFDVVGQHAQVRSRIGLAGQYAAVDEVLTGYENLQMMGRLSHLSKKAARRRALELLERFDLTEVRDRITKTYSGGMRRRLDLAASLVTNPSVLFLDEPTTGLDPTSRLRVWELLGELVVCGTTLLLTTQYLEEADQLSDRILMIDHGKVIADGTADQLKIKIGGARLEALVRDSGDLSAATAALARVGNGEPRVVGQRVTVPVSGGVSALTDAVRELGNADVTLEDLALRRPTLDEVFFVLTGEASETAETGEKR